VLHNGFKSAAVKYNATRGVGRNEFYSGGSNRSVLRISWLIDCVTSLMIIQPCNALFVQFLKGMKCENAPTHAVSLSQLVFIFAQLQKIHCSLWSNPAIKITICVNKVGTWFQVLPVIRKHS